jgi:hypothetical protein
MKWNAVTVIALMIMAVFMLGAAVSAVLTSRSPQSAGEGIAVELAAAAGDARGPDGADARPTSQCAGSASRQSSGTVEGLHVLAPMERGGYAHLLLTANGYYEALTAHEEELLTERLGAPVTKVDPYKLPPRSSRSVTDVFTCVDQDPPSS